MKNMKTAAGMLCLAGILSLGMGTTVFAEDGDSHYPVTITTYNYENEPVEMTFEKAPEKVFAYANSNIEELLALGLGDKIVAACGLDGDVREDLKMNLTRFSIWIPSHPKRKLLQWSLILLRHGILLSVMTGFRM